MSMSVAHVLAVWLGGVAVRRPFPGEASRSAGGPLWAGRRPVSHLVCVLRAPASGIAFCHFYLLLCYSFCYFY